MERERLAAALEQVRDHLLRERNPQGYWEGRLSSSPLSTAVAITALGVVDRARHPQAPLHQELVGRGADWILSAANPDGGWGDTRRSPSNLSTTLLCWSALGLAGRSEREEEARAWIAGRTEEASPERIAEALSRRYGRDRTFAVPILAMAALAGRLGPGRQAWRHVRALPFELAALPPRWYARLRLPVVSYALPALIAMGLVRHAFLPPRNPLLRFLRDGLRSRCLEALERIQPANGGFLEATPLTGFVAMSLAACGLHRHPVTCRAVEFLAASVREDGSWPIDTNLSTWVTTICLDSLADPRNGFLGPEERQEMAARLCRIQQRRIHPYTQARPGGWAWTDLPGGVPDADDTAGALIALHRLGVRSHAALRSARQGCLWLCGLQNRDGGVPTFCRGWGRLPFDRSSEDITAHALRAWTLWLPDLEGSGLRRAAAARRRALRFLLERQRGDGSWRPLWFGSQRLEDEENPVYGTSRVLLALAGTPDPGPAARARRMGRRFLELHQNEDGGWGGAYGAPSTVEETSLAVRALFEDAGSGPGARAARARGLDWLVDRVESGRFLEAAPIGLYFARLWYHERLYPPAFLAGALRRALRDH